MKKLKSTKIIASLLVVASLLALNPIGVSALASGAWEQTDKGWTYSSEYWDYTGWNLIDGNWYYFYDNCIMAHDTWIGSYYVNSNGVWVEDRNSTTNNSQVVNIADNNLKAIIKKEAGITSDVIYKKDVQNITHLMIRNANVSTLNGLENLTNLKGLGIIDDELYDISAISKLYNLEYVTLRSIKLKDMNYIINTLKGLPNLTHINLLGNNFVYADKQNLADAIPNAFTDYLTIGGKY